MENAAVANTKEGSIIKVDGAFTCMKNGTHKTVKEDDEGNLYVDCSEGKHYLDGQLSEDELYYVGLYLCA